MGTGDTIHQVPWDEIATTAEQLALLSFAARLSTLVTNEPDFVDEDDVRQEAQLLMNLMSSKPSSQTFCCGPDHSSSMEQQQHEETMDNTPVRRRRFTFSCPSLSLENNHQSSTSHGTASPMRKCSDASDDSIPSLVSTPALLLGRPLVVDDRDALRLSAEAMGRNVLRSFQKAVEWRFQTWIHSLSADLVRKERALIEQGASEQDLRELLNSKEAKVISSLRVASSQIEVFDAKTTFRVLPRRINHTEMGAPPIKKRKIEEHASLDTETEYVYRVTHALVFETVMNLNTPAGYTEVTIEVPGFIEGTFLSSDPGDELLRGVVVELDTRVLATMVERSSRVVARAATEAFIQPPVEVSDQESADTQELTTQECLPTPRRHINTATDFDNAVQAAIVTPRHPSPPVLYCDSDTEIMEKPISFPIDLDQEQGIIRMVSPQPRSPGFIPMSFAPRTPTNHKTTAPSLVSPPPSKTLSDEEGSSAFVYLSSGKGPSLPALVEVACAAMRAC